MATSNPYSRRSARRWYLTALALFWGSLATTLAIDFIGERWFGLTWTWVGEPFHMVALAIGSAIAQVASAVLLVIATVKRVSESKTFSAATLWVVLAALTALFCFLAYSVIVLFYHFDVMGRTA